MGNAIWLCLSLPAWYFTAVMNPLSLGIITLFPVLGILCLATGIVLSVIRKTWRPALFLSSALLSHALVSTAGFYRGKWDRPDALLYIFLVCQAGLLAYLVFRLKGERLIAICLAAFCASYAFTAAFIAAMAFPDTWI